MTFEKGKPVSILDDPQGTPWVMQAFSHIVDSNLTYDELEKLGDTLKPAPGWKCRVWPTLTVNSQSRQFDGVARIVQDEIEDTYDQCFEGSGQMVCTISHSRDSTARGGLQKKGLRAPRKGFPTVLRSLLV